MICHESSPVICEYPTTSSYFENEPSSSPAFLADPPSQGPGLGEPDPTASWLPNNTLQQNGTSDGGGQVEVLPPAWRRSIELPENKESAPPQAISIKVASKLSSPFIQTSHTLPFQETIDEKATIATRTNEPEKPYDLLPQRDGTSAHDQDAHIPESIPTPSEHFTTADRQQSFNHHDDHSTLKNAIHQSLPHHHNPHFVQTDAEENFAAPETNCDDHSDNINNNTNDNKESHYSEVVEPHYGTTLPANGNDIQAMEPVLDGHHHPYNNRCHHSLGVGLGDETPNANKHEAQQTYQQRHHPQRQQQNPALLNPYMSQNSAETSFISTPSSAQSAYGALRDGLRRPSCPPRARPQHAAYDVSFYGLENVDISSSPYALMSQEGGSSSNSEEGRGVGFLRVGGGYNETVEMENLSTPFQTLGEHVWEVAHEDEFGKGTEDGDGCPNQQLRVHEARPKPVQRLVRVVTPPLTRRSQLSGSQPSGGGYGRGGRALVYGPTSRDLRGPPSLHPSMYRQRQQYHCRTRKSSHKTLRVIQIPPRSLTSSTTRESESVYGLDSYEEAVVNGVAECKSRPPLTRLQKAQRTVRRLWKNCLCLLLLVSLVIAVPIMIHKHSSSNNNNNNNNNNNDGQSGPSPSAGDIDSNIKARPKDGKYSHHLTSTTATHKSVVMTHNATTSSAMPSTTPASSATTPNIHTNTVTAAAGATDSPNL